MAQAVGQVLSLGVGVALSPIPIVGVVLMLGTSRGRVNGPSFLAGWVAGLAVVGAAVLLISGGADATDKGEPAGWVDALRIVLGLVLLRIAVREWRGRARDGEEPRMPGWLRTVDRLTATRAAAFGVALSAVNPKNLNRVGTGLNPAPPTPPDVRVRIRRFASCPGGGGRARRIP